VLPTFWGQPKENPPKMFKTKMGTINFDLL